MVAKSAMPSESTRSDSGTKARPAWLTMKPGVSLQRTGVWPKRCASAVSASVDPRLGEHAVDHLDDLHHRHRVEEVVAGDAPGPLARRRPSRSPRATRCWRRGCSRRRRSFPALQNSCFLASRSSTIASTTTWQGARASSESTISMRADASCRRRPRRAGPSRPACRAPAAIAVLAPCAPRRAARRTAACARRTAPAPARCRGPWCRRRRRRRRDRCGWGRASAYFSGRNWRL